MLMMIKKIMTEVYIFHFIEMQTSMSAIVSSSYRLSSIERKVEGEVEECLVFIPGGILQPTRAIRRFPKRKRLLEDKLTRQ
jgi:hypothetical protein